MNTASPAAARRRQWAYVLLALVVLLVIASALTWRFRISVAEMAAEQSLRLMGLDGIAFDIAEAETDRVQLENLRIGDNGPSAKAATLTFSPGGLMNGELRALDKALEDANEGTGLAVKTLSNFAYDEISIRINDIEAEELRLDIKTSGRSVELYGGLPFEFNIKVKGPIRQIIQENLARPQLPPDVQGLIERSRR